jgi:hypothetical protein
MSDVAVSLQGQNNKIIVQSLRKNPGVAGLSSIQMLNLTADDDTPWGWHILPGDFNQDLVQDLAVLVWDPTIPDSGKTGFAVLRGENVGGTGNGRFNYDSGIDFYPIAPMGISASPSLRAVLADANAGGDPDLLAGRWLTGPPDFGDIRMVAGGDGVGFAAATTVWPESTGDADFLDLAPADLNGDGLQDLVAIQSVSDQFSTLFLRQDSSSTTGFSSWGQCDSAEDSLNAVAVADLDQDCAPDVISVSSASTLTVNCGIRVDPALDCGAPREFPVLVNAKTELAVKDFDGDGRRDIAVGYRGGKVQVMYNVCP